MDVLPERPSIDVSLTLLHKKCCYYETGALISLWLLNEFVLRVRLSVSVIGAGPSLTRRGPPASARMEKHHFCSKVNSLLSRPDSLLRFSNFPRVLSFGKWQVKDKEDGDKESASERVIFHRRRCELHKG